MKNSKIGFIGAGNIASAIISGILKSDYIIPENIYVFDLDKEKLKEFTKLGIKEAFDTKELTLASDFIFLTVKPQVYPTVLGEIKEASKGKCFVDVAAGITIDFIKEILGQDTAVVRVMPNTPLTVGCGSTALVKGNGVSDFQFDFVKKIFASSGVTVTVDEKYINAVTAISGSSPAFILQLAKNLIEFGVSNGLDEADAKILVLNTLQGSAKLALDGEDTIQKLIDKVTSPGGTTAAGRELLDAAGFDDLVKSCLDKTLNRAKELTK